MQTLYQTLKNKLKAEAGLEYPELEARVILRHVLGVSDADLITGRDLSASPEQQERIEHFLDRRRRGEPLSRILGQREFWGLVFRVTPDTLDPRPDTETLVRTALDLFGESGPQRILDLGTGTGCILISLLYEWPRVLGVGLDISPAALEIAQANARRNNVDARARFLESDWFAGLADSNESFDLIVSNPPYIPHAHIESLAPEVKNHDPILALSGGADGLGAHKIILTETKRHLRPGGKLLLEIGYDQSDSIQRLAGNAGATLSRIIPDLAGNPRVAEITYGDN